MKIKNAYQQFNGPVSGTWLVYFEVTEEEREELKKALAIVDKYKKKANEAAKHKEKNADWTEHHFDVKKNEVKVVIECGACG